MTRLQKRMRARGRATATRPTRPTRAAPKQPPKPGPDVPGPVDTPWLCWEDYAFAAMVPFFGKGMGGTVGDVDPVGQCAAGIRAVVDAWCAYGPVCTPDLDTPPGQDTLHDAYRIADAIARQLYEGDVVDAAVASLASFFVLKSSTCGVPTI